jgi:hypothetical protein
VPEVDDRVGPCERGALRYVQFYASLISWLSLNVGGGFHGGYRPA